MKPARIPATVLGATGVVGQRFVARLSQHPAFEVAHLCASERSAGKRYDAASAWRLAERWSRAPYGGLGARTLLAAYCYVVGGDHEHADPTRPILEQGRSSRGVSVGSGVWLGADVKVLDGATIGDGAIVGAGAVVRGDIPAMAVAVGMPARIVGSREPAVPGTQV